MTSPELHTFTGAYAADALEPAERAEFEQHLAACAACAQEVRELQATAAALGAAAQQEPPERLHDRVMAEVSRTRQLPPLSAGGDGADHGGEGPVRRDPHRRLPRWVPAVAAAMVLLILGLGASTVVLHRQLEAERRPTDQVAALLDAPDARAVAATSADGVGGVVVMSRRRGELVFVSSGLTELAGDRTYQLWLQKPEGMVPAGLLEAEDGNATEVVRDDLSQVTAVGLTVEPAGGSSAPTTDPVLVVEMPSA